MVHTRAVAHARVMAQKRARHETNCRQKSALFCRRKCNPPTPQSLPLPPPSILSEHSLFTRRYRIPFLGKTKPNKTKLNRIRTKRPVATCQRRKGKKRKEKGKRGGGGEKRTRKNRKRNKRNKNRLIAVASHGMASNCVASHHIARHPYRTDTATQSIRSRSRHAKNTAVHIKTVIHPRPIERKESPPKTSLDSATPSRLKNTLGGTRGTRVTRRIRVTTGTRGTREGVVVDRLR